jgi:hypothetical protein
VGIEKILEQWGLTGEKTELVGKTEHNSTWFVGSGYVLQHSIHDMEKLARLTQTVDGLRAQGIPAIKYVKWTDDGAFRLMERLPGSHVDFYEQPQLMGEMGRALAGLLVGNMNAPQKLATWKEMYRYLPDGYDEISPLAASERAVLPALLIAIELLFVTYFAKTGNPTERDKAAELALWLYKSGELTRSGNIS